MSYIKIATVAHRTKRLNNPEYVKQRILKRLSESKNYLIGKHLFHFISVFSTTVMLASSLIDWIKVPLLNIGINIEQYGDDLFIPTVVISATLSVLLEVTTTKSMSSTIAAIKQGVGAFDVGMRVFAMSVLVATQLYTFVGGAKNTITYAMVPSTYKDEIRQNKKSVEFYKNLENSLSEKIQDVKDGKRAIDDNYGTGDATLAATLQKKLTAAKRAYSAYVESEKRKPVNLDKSGKLNRVAKALLDKRYMEQVKPLEDAYNKAVTTTKDAKKIWLANAEADLNKIREKRVMFQNKVKSITEEYNRRLEQVSQKIKDIYYWYGAIFLLVGLSAMDFMHNRTLEDALKGYDSAKKSDLNRDDDNFDPKSFLPDDSEQKEPKEYKHTEETKTVNTDEARGHDDREFLDYIAKYYAEHGKVPGTQTIVDDLKISTRDITEIFKRNDHYFERKNGVGTIAKEAFLWDYCLDDPAENNTKEAA